MNKISINALERVIDENAESNEKVIEWNGIEVKVKKRLGLKEVLSFVSDVSKACFAADTKEYLPEVKDFAVRCCVLEYYSNFRLPSNIEKRYDVVYACDAFDTVLGLIDGNQFSLMIDAIEEKINNIANSNISLINAQAEKVYASISSIEEKLSSVFNGIDVEKIPAFINAVSENGVDEKKIMSAYLEMTGDKKE